MQLNQPAPENTVTSDKQPIRWSENLVSYGRSSLSVKSQMNLQNNCQGAPMDDLSSARRSDSWQIHVDQVQSSSATTEKRILLIEDDDTNRQMLSDFLAFYGYTVRGIATGAELLSALDEFCPGVILMDIKLPDVSGYTLLDQLGQHPRWFHIPVVVVSAHAFRADQARALQLGASQYFVKPVDLKQLINAIETEFEQVKRI
ncbi:MAG: response regulator [Cyanobacteria bacterium J06627_8]